MSISMKHNELYKSTKYMRLIVFFLFYMIGLSVPIHAQREYYGDLDDFTHHLQKALDEFYNLSVECVTDEQNRPQLMYGIEKNFLHTQGVYVPDFTSYKGIDAIVSYTNYINTFLKEYGKQLKPGSIISSDIRNLKILKATWTEDGKGVLLNVAYNIAWSLDGNLLYKGCSQALACFLDFRDVLSCRLDQVTPYGWNPEEIALNNSPTKKMQLKKESVKDNWFERAIQYYRSYEYNQSFRIFRQKADEGDPDAWGFLGHHYYYGRGTEQDTIKAKECYIKTHQYDTPLCKYFQSNHYLEGSYGLKKDTVKAFRLALESAEQEDSYGINLLGWCYLYGVGTEKDLQKAQGYFNIAIQKGNGLGYMNLAQIYSDRGIAEKILEYEMKGIKMGSGNFGMLSLYYGHGIGCQPDTVKQLHYAQLGEKYKDPLATFLLGEWYMKKSIEHPTYYQKAIDYYHKADKLGNIDAGKVLGYHYIETDSFYIKRDFIKNRFMKWIEAYGSEYSSDLHYLLSELYLNFTNEYNVAFGYCEKAAKGGHKYANAKLGYYYHKIGVPKFDKQMAILLYTLSENDDKGFFSYYGLGSYYMEENNTQSKSKAKKYLTEGCRKGYPSCLYYVGMAALEGKYGYPKDSQFAAECFEKGMRCTFKPSREAVGCKVQLGLLYAEGKVPSPKPLLAIDMWKQALNQGYGYAAYLLGFAYEHGKYGVKKNRQVALRYYQKGEQLYDSSSTGALHKLQKKM